MAPQLVQVLKARFYNSRSCMGYKYPELITRISSVTLSFTATVIQVALKQWEKGELNKKVSMGTEKSFSTFIHLSQIILQVNNTAQPPFRHSSRHGKKRNPLLRSRLLQLYKMILGMHYVCLARIQLLLVLLFTMRKMMRRSFYSKCLQIRNPVQLPYNMSFQSL